MGGRFIRPEMLLCRLAKALLRRSTFLWAFTAFLIPLSTKTVLVKEGCDILEERGLAGNMYQLWEEHLKESINGLRGTGDLKLFMNLLICERNFHKSKAEG